MKPTRTDSPLGGCGHGRWLAAALLAGLVTLALSACSKQPEPSEPRDGKQKAEANGKDKGSPKEAPQDLAKKAEVARRSQSENNLKQILLALHSFHDTYKRLPPAAICDKQTGKPLLSWRVAILPYIEQANLYKQFKLDELWDSPHNKKLAETVVPVYAPPGAKDREASKTFYRVFVAPRDSAMQTAWQTFPQMNSPYGAWGGKLFTIRDGTSNTIGVVEAGEAVPWSKPDELLYDAKKPLPKLGGLFKDGFHAAMMDAAVYFFADHIDEDTRRALITANGGEPVLIETLQEKGLAKATETDDKKAAAGNGTPKVATGDEAAKEASSEEKGETDPRRRQSINNLKEILFALHNFQQTYGAFPPAAICDKMTGKPLLSWRVLILPYLEQANLYKQFKLDEPWDSPHNKKLTEIVVPTYAPPGAKPGQGHKTYYRVFVAPPRTMTMTAWDRMPNPGATFGARGLRISDIFDGTANTLGVVEAGEAVPWSKPDELVYDAKKPLPKLGGLFPDGFHAGMMDASVWFISNRIDDASLRTLITARSGDFLANAVWDKGLIRIVYRPRPER